MNILESETEYSSLLSSKFKSEIWYQQILGNDKRGRYSGESDINGIKTSSSKSPSISIDPLWDEEYEQSIEGEVWI